MPTPTKAQRLAPDHLSLLLDDWRTSLKAKNLAATTISSYRRCALNLLAYLAEKGMPQTASGIAREHVESFIADLLDRVSEATAAKHYRSLQQLFNWLESDGEIDRSPMSKMSPPQVVDKPPSVLTPAVVRKLLDASKGNTFENRRDQALITFLYDSGCRVGEVVGMNVADYDPERHSATVTGKGNRTRGVNTGRTTVDAFRRYLRARRAHPLAEQSEAFWLGRKGPLTVSGVAQILNRRCREAGVPHIHPHQFRHTFAHEWQVAGGNENDLMSLAGWRSREMAARYGRSAAGERAQAAHQKLSPADRLLK